MAARRRREPAVTSAFWFLTERSIRNRVAHQIKSLKRPRYALAMLFGFFYIYSVYLRPGGRANRPALGDDAAVIAAVLVLVMIAAWWVFGGDRSALAFSPAEVQFLFPAPVTRGDLIRFKLLRAQPQVLVSVLIGVVLFKRGASSPTPAALQIIAYWVIISTLHMHRLGASLVRANTGQHGVAGAKRTIAAWAVVGGAMTAVIATLVIALPRLQAALANGDFIQMIASVLRQPVSGAVLTPVLWLLAPLFAIDSAAWLSAIWPALVLLVLHYFWVVRTHAAFEDAAVEASAKRADRLATMRARRMGAPLSTNAKAAAKESRERPARTWIPLSPTGHPAVAILWKNIVSIAREVRRSTLLLLIAGTLTIYVALSKVQEGTDLRPGSYLLIGMAGFLAVIGPMWIRNDFRTDLTKLELLRGYPLDPRALVVAEIASSTLLLTGLQLTLVLIAFVVTNVTKGPALFNLSFATQLAALAGLVVLTPLLNAVSLTIQNAVALLFPAWVKLGAVGGGIEAIGQTMMVTVASVLLLALAWLLPVIVAGLTILLLWTTYGAMSLVPAITLAVIGVAAEVWLMVQWLATVFARTESIAE